MLQYSKFVNTKAMQKAASRKAPVQLPIFTKSVQINKAYKNDVEAPDVVTEKQATPPPEKAKPVVHPSVNLEEMQRKEELKKKDQDWLEFFLGMTSADSKPASKALPAASFASTDFAPAHEPLVTPAPEGPACLDDIFKDLIQDDNGFQKSVQ